MDALQYSIPNVRHDRALPESNTSLPYMQCSGICFFSVMGKVEKAWSGEPGYTQGVIETLITESHRLRLEKTSKIINSSCQTNAAMPAKPCPEVPHLHVFLKRPGMVTPPLPWAACSNA